jgi:hypothetical protein
MTTSARILAASLALAAPLAAAALEPRFDHRDQMGVLAALEYWRESTVVSGKPTLTDTHPRLRLGWGWDVTGEGNELILGGSLRLGDWKDQERMRQLYGIDARYRGYFGTEELKTFFEVGLWGQFQNKLAIGPQAGLGVAYDPNRGWGGFFSLHFGTAFGEARIASLGASAGVQIRFE